MRVYTREYYRDISRGAGRSSAVMVPILMNLISPRSVADVGCGEGGWLDTFKQHGVQKILGIDSEYVDRASLKIPEQDFISADLTKPFRHEQRFDLVLSLEVAEHLPIDTAECFVNTLTRLGPVIAFSAAIPFQGGQHHVNEQWPAYWADKFERRGYAAIDCLRQSLWSNSDIDWWYAQNTLVYVERAHLTSLPAVQALAECSSAIPPALVHPTAYSELIRRNHLEIIDPSFGSLGNPIARALQPLKRLKWQVFRLTG